MCETCHQGKGEGEGKGAETGEPCELENGAAFDGTRKPRGGSGLGEINS